MLPATQYRQIEAFQGQKWVFQGYAVFQGHIQLQEMQQQQATTLQTNKQPNKKTDRGENNTVWFSEKSSYKNKSARLKILKALVKEKTRNVR